MKKILFCLAFAGLMCFTNTQTSDAAVLNEVTVKYNKKTGQTTITQVDKDGRTHTTIKDKNGRVILEN